MSVTRRIKVLIIDDSALVRDILEKGLSLDPEIEVVGKASDVYSARDKIVLTHPDVLTLDVEMPRMDGVEFLRRLMPQFPIPVVMVSSMTKEGSRITLEALDAGAIDFVLKPSALGGNGLREMMDELIDKIKAAAFVDVSRYRRTEEEVRRLFNQPKHSVMESTDKVIAVGASTGGTVALTKVLAELPGDFPGMVVVQHMPPVFTKMFAETLQNNCRLAVKEAEDGDRIVGGRVLIAPGGLQTSVVRSGGEYRVKCAGDEKVNGHSPSVDVMFHSVAEAVGANALGLIMTGMGRDGAEGMLAMRKAGARTIAQDEASSVVYGMPKEAFLNGGAEKRVALDEIPGELLKLVTEMRG